MKSSLNKEFESPVFKFYVGHAQEKSAHFYCFQFLEI